MTSPLPGVLDDFLRSLLIKVGGVLLPKRTYLNFIGFTVADNEANDSTDVSGAGGAGVYGDGSDATATCDGTTAVAGMTLSGGNYTLTRDVVFSSLTINSGVSVNGNGWRVFALSLIVSGHLHADGSTGDAGSAVVPGGGGSAGTSALAGGGYGWGGSTDGLSITVGLGGHGGRGAISGSVGGAVTDTPDSAHLASVRVLPRALDMITWANATAVGGTLSGGLTVVAGGAGGGSGGVGGGPGGGSGGGVLVVAARALSGSGSITAKGGQGGPSAGGGAGGGGGGGVIVIASAANTFTGVVSVAGGPVGTGSGGSQSPGPGLAGTIIQLQG